MFRFAIIGNARPYTTFYPAISRLRDFKLKYIRHSDFLIPMVYIFYPGLSWQKKIGSELVINRSSESVNNSTFSRVLGAMVLTVKMLEVESIRLLAKGEKISRLCYFIFPRPTIINTRKNLYGPHRA